METNTNVNNYLFSDFPPLTLSSLMPEPSRRAAHQNPRKKRKSLRIGADQIAKPKPARKPDPSAPNISTTCTECGRNFWSLKALFGHMRCHPERQWRGIIPPPTLRRPDITTEEDHEVAACLLMLANGPSAAAASDTTACTEFSESDIPAAPNCGRFECSSCKKVFGSHQALGGHRASHKNVKGCYAITKSYEEEEEVEGCCSDEVMMMMLKDHSGHKCSICFRVFSSGQALGGHMRCHWEKVGEPSRICDFDLNLAAPPHQNDDDADASSLPYPSGGLALDLRLGF